MSRFWLLLALQVARIICVNSPTHILKERHVVPRDWIPIARATPGDTIRLRIALKQGNFEKLESRLWEISDPSHDSYGKHLSAQQVREFISPANETIDAVREWLQSHGIEEHQLEYSLAKDWISIRSLSISSAERLLQTKYHVYQRGSHEVIRTSEWSLPLHLHEHIDTIQPTTSFFHLRTDKTSEDKKPTSLNDFAEDIPEGLSILKGIDLANPPADLTPQEACNITAVTPMCLRTLYGTLNYKTQAADKNSMAVCNYVGEFNNRSDMRHYLEIYRPEAVRAAEEFTIHEIAGGINRQTPSTKAQLDEGGGKEGGLDAQLMAGIGFPTPLVTYSTGGDLAPFQPDPAITENTNEPFLTWLDYILSQKDLPTVVSTSYADTEYTVPPAYAKRVCQGFAQLGARGVSVIFGSGDGGVGKPKECHDSAGKPRFVPRFPDSCPYITSVAATRGIDPQVVAYNERNGFVSGGGFSDYFKRPKYQDAVVEKYMKKLGGKHQGLYNPHGRAYPDVAAMGYRIVTIWNGKAKVVDGTSASGPIFGAVVALLNDALIAEGKPPLGFLNPWIYSVGSEGFNDVVHGSTKGCNTSGFPAMEGWDVASGFGTPWFPKLRELASVSRFRALKPWYMLTST